MYLIQNRIDVDNKSNKRTIQQRTICASLYKKILNKCIQEKVSTRFS